MIEIVSRQMMRRLKLYSLHLPAMLRAFTALWLCSLLQLNANAEVFYADAGMVLERKIVDARDLVKCETRIPFAQFRYPHLNALFDATYLVDPSSSSDQQDKNVAVPGIYRSFRSPEKTVPLVLAEDLVQGATPDEVYFRGLQTHENNYVFATIESNDIQGIYASFDGGDTVLIARTFMKDQNGTPHYRPHYGAIFDDQVLYTSLLGPMTANGRLLSGGSGFEDAPAPGDYYALYLYNHTSSNTVMLVRSGTPLPGAPGKSITRLRPQNWMHEADVVFRANDTRGGSGVYAIRNVDIRNPESFAPSRIELIADCSTPMPSGRGRLFGDFTSAPVDSGRIAFVGYDSPDRNCKGCFNGVYFHDGRQLMAIVDTETVIPGKSFRFTGFSKWVAMDKGKVVFIGFGPDNYQGIFLFDPNQSILFTFIDNTEVIDGRPVSDFEVGSNCLVGNRLVFLMEFKDHTRAIYLAATPRVIARILDRSSDPFVTHPLAR